MRDNKSKTKLIPMDGTFQHVLEDKVPLLKKALSYKGNETIVHQLIQGLHPSEIAYLIQYLEAPYRETFVTWLKPSFNPEVFLFLANNLRENIISLLSAEDIASILGVLESDDALSLLSTLEDEQQHAVLEVMPAGDRKSLEQRLKYPPHSAGRLMQQEVLALPQDWTIQKSLKYIAHAQDLPTEFYDAFIISPETRQPVGVLHLSQLIKSPKQLTLCEVMDRDVRTIPAQWNQEEVAFIFRLYDLMSAPVVDQNNALIGMITIDDVVDVIERKATEDLMHMGRIHSSDFHESVIKTSFSRLHWLIITLLNTLLTSVVINQFQETLKEKVALTILMPIAAAMGGNAGIQSSTVVIRAIATRELGAMNMVRTFFKEVKVALMNGGIFAIFLSIIVFYWFQEPSFSLVLGGAVIFNMLWAGLAGTFFPILISRMGFDPALSSGPLLTTTTDVLGYLLFLGLAKIILD